MDPVMQALMSMKGGGGAGGMPPQMPGGGAPGMGAGPAQWAGQQNPMGSNEDGNEVFVEKGLFGGGKLNTGDQVTLTGTVTVTGVKIGVSIATAMKSSGVEVPGGGLEDIGLGSEEEEDSDNL